MTDATHVQTLHTLSRVPFREFGKTRKGMDCFGLVEFWYANVLGVHLADRRTQKSNPRGFTLGFVDRKNWFEIKEPVDHCVAVMETVWLNRVWSYGHCGIVYDNRVYHIRPEGGFQHHWVFDPMAKITAFMEYRDVDS